MATIFYIVLRRVAVTTPPDKYSDCAICMSLYGGVPSKFPAYDALPSEGEKQRNFHDRSAIIFLFFFLHIAHLLS